LDTSVSYSITVGTAVCDRVLKNWILWHSWCLLFSATVKHFQMKFTFSYIYDVYIL
jgi:hypothetical protein